MKMNYLSALALGTFLFAAVSCSNTNNNAGSSDSTQNEHMMSDMDSLAEGEAAHADISATKSDTTGSGTADFVKKDDGTVELTLNLHFPTMANKSVAVHLHEHGDCSDEGKGAHGHWNPTNENHGKWGSDAYHSGDIGNVQLDAEGRGELTMSGDDRWTIGGSDQTNILNRAVIVHSGVDDYTTQPTGNAGSRIGCGVIMAK